MGIRDYIHQNAVDIEYLLSTKGKKRYKKTKDNLYYAMNTVTNEALIQAFNKNYTRRLSYWINKRPFYNRILDQDRKNFVYNLLKYLKNCRTAEDYTNFLVILQRAIAKYATLAKLPRGQSLIHPRDKQLVNALTQLTQRILETHVFGVDVSVINDQGGWGKTAFDAKRFGSTNRLRLDYSAEQMARIRGVLPALQVNARSNRSFVQACEKFFAWHKEHTPLQEQIKSSNPESFVNESLFEASENYSGELNDRNKVIQFRNQLRQKLNAHILVDLINTTGRVEMKAGNITLAGSVANMIIGNIPFPGARLVGGAVETAANWYEESCHDQNADTV